MDRRGLLVSLFLLKVLMYAGGYGKVSGCLDSERKALITFRKALNDPSSLLSSWDDASGCCNWRGITCDNITGYVLKLDLHRNLSDQLISGRIDPALVQLKHLQFLDLSFNAFYGAPIPDFLGSMKELRHLDLSFAGFSGRIPHQLGNLSKLISLKLSSSSSLSAKNLWWLTRLRSLNYLDMSYVNLSMASHDWVHVMNMSPSLVELYLWNCGLSYISPTLPSVNFTSLRVLHLGYNNFNSSIPNWIANISSLVSLYLSFNKFQGQIPYQFSQLPNLEELWLGSSNDNLRLDWSEFLEGSWRKLKILDLSVSQLHGGIPNSIWNMTSLEALSLSFSENITGSIPRAITKLINLEWLSLDGYHMNSAIPDWLDELKNLKHLDLSNCMLTGPIPTTLGQLSNLYLLDLSSNSLTGNVSERAFENLKKLMYLDLSSNSLVFDPHSDWDPPFQLSDIDLRSCHLGPRFPLWLQTQKYIENLDLSNTTISGIIPTWFWDLTPQFLSLNLSNNQIFGQLPNPLEMLPQAWYIDLSLNNFNGPMPYILNGARVLDLSNNKFSGPIPPNFTSTMQYLEYFSARGNQISGTIPSFIEGMNSLTVLDLSRNNIGGIIPSSLSNCISLEALDLSKNRLSRGIPTSLGLLRQLRTMHLSNNNLSGEIPSSLKKCTSLETLDLGHNNFSGYIPTWIGESFPALRILSFRSNLFSGNIPSQLSKLTSLQVLDVAQNCLFGSIPQSFENLMAMKNEQKTVHFISYGNSILYYRENLLVSVRGKLLEFTRTISMVTCMDLSSNNLSGEIPEGLTSLLGLRTLNLSGNHLIGRIPNKTGKLALLESLDLSRNQLSGAIPLSISNLTFLSYLNLSYNILSGRIPSGNQLQTLEDPSIYMGNSGLCGPPLTVKCVGDETSQGPNLVGGDVEKDEEDNKMLWFYSAMGPGFAAGLWAFCCLLMFNNSWRIAYYHFFDDMIDRLFL